MSKEFRWLASEIDRWIADGVITPQQGVQIRARYAPAPGATPALSWGLIVFFALGAIVVGLGVVLLLAYNWAGIPKLGKLALIFGATIAAHGSGVYFRAKPDWRSMLGEGTLVLGTMLFGAGIWLVAQIYNIDEHFPTGFLVWGLGALALAWAVPSVPQAIIATLVLAIWGTVEVVEFGNAVDWATLLLVAGTGTLAWRQRSAVLMAVVLAAVYVQVLAHAVHWGGGGTAFAVAVALSVGLIGVADLARGAALPGRFVGVLRFYGLTGFVVCAYMLSFLELADDILRAMERNDTHVHIASTYRWLLFVAALGLHGLAIARRLRRGGGLPGPEAWFYPLGLIAVMVATSGDAREGGVVVAIVFNLVLLGVSALWIVHGCRDGRLPAVVLGSIVLGLLVFARYFDLFDSLVARGLAFVLFGSALFAEGFYYRKMRLVRVDGEAGP